MIALSLFLWGVFMPLAGIAVDRFSVRIVTSAGTVLLIISLWSRRWCGNFGEFAAVYGVLVPLGLAGTGPAPSPPGVVARWFSKRRGTALSVLGSASMTGMSLLVPAVTWLILTTGWRVTYVLIAAAIGVILLPCAVGGPRLPGVGRVDRRWRGPECRGGADPPERVGAGEALGTLAFWQLAGSFFTCGFSMSLLSAHGIPMLTDHGYSAMFASWVLGVLGGSSIGFTVMLGALSDRLGRRPVLAGIYAGRVLIFAGFFLIRDNPAAILAVAVLGGITMAGTGSMTSALTADIYGRFSVSSVFGLIFLVHQTGSAAGSWLAGALFETTGGYGAAYVLACLFLVGAADRGAQRRHEARGGSGAPPRPRFDGGPRSGPPQRPPRSSRPAESGRSSIPACERAGPGKTKIVRGPGSQPMSSCSSVMSTSRDRRDSPASAPAPTTPDVGRPRRLEGGAAVEPELGDPVPRLPPLVRGRARDQAHAILPEAGELLGVGHVLVEPPAMELLTGDALAAAKHGEDLDRALVTVDRLHHVFQDGVEELARLLGVAVGQRAPWSP